MVGLRELLRSHRPPQNTIELAQLAERLDPHSEIAAYLRSECADLPPDLALQDASVRQRKLTFRRVQQLRALGAEAQVVFIPPVPRHISEPLLDCPTVAMVEAGHEVPHHLRFDPRVQRISDAYAARSHLEAADLIVFDGFFSGGILHVRRAVAALLDLRVLKQAAALFAHFRGRPFPEDVPLPPELSARINRL